MLSAVDAADAAKKDPEQFKIRPQDPANFTIEGPFPLHDLNDKPKEARKGQFWHAVASQA